jgi:hypothetical protein
MKCYVVVVLGHKRKSPMIHVVTQKIGCLLHRCLDAWRHRACLPFKKYVKMHAYAYRGQRHEITITYVVSVGSGIISSKYQSE